MKKQFLSLFFLLILLSVFTLSFNVAADSEIVQGTCGNSLNWSLNTGSGELVITGSGKMNTYSSSSMPWKEYKDLIKTVSISDSVTSIGDCAFYGCAKLTSVTIGKNVTVIREKAFYDCNSLTSVAIGNSVTSILSSAFSNCTGLTSIIIPDSVTKIFRSAFSGCIGLKNITIGNSVTSISSSVFDNCSNLESITVDENNSDYRSAGNCLIETESKTLIIGCKNSIIPVDGSVTSIGEAAFAGCSGLTSVTIPDSVTHIGYNAFSGCIGLKGIIIPNSVISIGYNAFSGCIGLTEINIPDSVSSIGERAFSGCTGLESIAVGENNSIYHSSGNCLIETESKKLVFGCKNSIIPIDGSVTIINYSAFYGCVGLTEIIIPDSVKSLFNSAFRDCTELESVTIGNSVKIIGNEVFQGCTRLTEIIIPNNVTDLGGAAFRNCTGLKNVTIGNGVTFIGGSAFQGCTGLENVTIGNSVTNIGASAFQGCSVLTEVTIPDSVASLGNSAFQECTELKNVTIGNSVTSINDCTFQGCTELTSVTIGNSVTDICWRAFYDCTGLKNITMPFGVKRINNSAFYGCTGLENVTIGNSVTHISAYAFSGCTGLTEITIPDSVTFIGTHAFSGCTGLESVYIGKSVTEIDDYAFQDCTALTEIYYNAENITLLSSKSPFSNAGTAGNGIAVVFGDSVESIPNHLFRVTESEYKPKIVSAIISNHVISIGERAFSGCSGLENVTIGNSVTSIGDSAFRDCIGLKNITIGNSVTSIRSSVFGNCSNLESITVDENNTIYHSAGNCLIETESKKLIRGCKNSVIPEDGSVTSIGDAAFFGCTGLTDINIPNSVTSIGVSAFSDCAELTSVSISNSVTKIPGYAFRNCTELTDVYYPGTQEQWDDISIGSYNDNLLNAEIHFNYIGPYPVKKFTIYFKVNGELIEKHRASEGEIIPAPPEAPAKEDFSFIGWTYAAEDGTPYTENTVPAFNLIATANYMKCVESACADRDTAIKGEYITWTIVTSKEVEYIKITGRYAVDGVNKASSVMYRNTTTSSSVKIIEDDVSRTWTVTQKASLPTGVDSVQQNYTMYYKIVGESAYKVYNDEPITISVYAEKTVMPEEVAGEYIAPFTVVSVTAPESVTVGKYGTVTIVTTIDCDKVRIGYNNGTVMKYATYQTTSKNNVSYADDESTGLRTWTINYKFATNATGYTVQGRGPVWSAENGKTFSVSFA